MAKILVVDDSNSIRQVVMTSLKMDGHSPEQAEDGAIALEMAKKEKFDVVVTDLNMPNMNGLELTAALRALPNYKYIPILLLTTESSMSKKAEGKKAGATGWLVKPFQPVKLLAAIKKVV